uniref:Putative Phospholipase D3 n=2 Tax=Megacormus gertschi TaxID=1843536 RepID=A0A224XGI0_9SCOR
MGIRISSIYRQQTVVENIGKLDVGEFELQLFDSRYMLKKTEITKRKWNGWIKPSCIPITIIFILIVLVVMLPLLEQKQEDKVYVLADTGNCTEPCWVTLVESIPENLTYSTTLNHPSTFDGWLNLIHLAEHTIDIAAFYWTLRGSDVVPDPSDWQGEKIFQELLAAGTERKIKISIVQNLPSYTQPDNDTKELEEKGAAVVRNIDFEKLIGKGILHTKMWIVDNKHFYIGSANMDWRALTQVKELGIVAYNCSCLTSDLKKIFDAYWLLSESDHIPKPWPSYFDTVFNKTHPAIITINDTSTRAYLSSSPPQFCAKGRTSDINSILSVIKTAKKFIHIAVMDYFPAIIYTKHLKYWPVIDDALREAAVTRGIKIKVLASHWQHTRPIMLSFLRSLQALNSTGISIETKLFIVPTYSPSQAKIPYARVNHNKYMVTDDAAYIGTSNWSGDYFISTGGVGFILQNSENYTNSYIQVQLQAVFERDWFSEYAHPITEVDDIR